MLQVPRVLKWSGKVDRAGQPTAHLAAGELAPPGIYVVSHFGPAHTVAHEVLVTTWMNLPQCLSCSGIRFSLKCRIPERIEESAFFGLELLLESSILAAHLRDATEEVRSTVTNTREFLARSIEFLAAF
jgi:hypothetical protein